MDAHKPINLDWVAGGQPVFQLVTTIMRAAAHDRIDCVLFELDVELHKKVEADSAKMMLKGIMPDFSKLPLAFQITCIKGEKKEKLSLMSGILFEPVLNTLSGAARYTNEANGSTSLKLETINPQSTWRLEVNDSKSKLSLWRDKALNFQR